MSEDKSNVVYVDLSHMQPGDTLTIPVRMIEIRPHIAPEGKIWVCMTCLTKERDRDDFDNELCWGDAVLCDEVQPAPGFYAVAARDD